MITKIHYTKGARFDFGTHINEFLVPREKALSSETFLVIIRPGKATHLHMHPDMEQIFYVIKGRGSLFTCTNARVKLRKVHEIKSGDVVHIPLKTWHTVSCAGKRPLEYLCVDAFPKGHLHGEKTALAHARNVVAAEKKKKNR